MGLEYKKNYWGFIYLWRDRASNMYCIGSHFGRCDDGYLSSTGNFEAAYNARPSHFMRRIVYWLASDDRSVLLQEEARWLSFIRPQELSTSANHAAETVRYYNCKKFAVGGAWNKGRIGVQNYPRLCCNHCGGFYAAGMLAAWHGDRCLSNPEISAADLDARARKKRIRQPAYVADNINSLPLVECGVCGLIATRGNIARWHGEKCKARNAASFRCAAA